ncbi:MAG: hypothetical protein GY931_12385 [Maribacter sp.]|nr:hypothetical protein [Maribacter sp.]
MLSDAVIPKLDSMHDLGVIMTKELTFNQHIEAITKSATTMANLILRTFKSRKPAFMIQMFNVFVRSKLEYASPIWNPHHQMLINRIEKVQRRFTKRLPFLSDVTYKNRLLFLKTSSLELRRLHLDLVCLYKLLHGHFDIDTSTFFRFKQTSTRGNSWALVRNHFKTDVKKFSFAQRIVNIWNYLPNDIVNLTTVPAFKKSLHGIDFGRFLRGVDLGV